MMQSRQASELLREGRNMDEPAEEAQHTDGTVECANSIFHQPWWLDAVAPGGWDAVVVEEEKRLEVHVGVDAELLSGPPDLRAEVVRRRAGAVPSA